MYYSILEYKPHWHAEPTFIGVVVFTFDSDENFISQLRNDLPQGIDTRIMMAARAVVNRLKKDNPSSLEEVKSFMSKEANEVLLTIPETIIADSPIIALNYLSNTYLTHEYVDFTVQFKDWEPEYNNNNNNNNNETIPSNIELDNRTERSYTFLSEQEAIDYANSLYEERKDDPWLAYIVVRKHTHQIIKKIK